VLRKILVVDDFAHHPHVYELFLSRYRGTRLVPALDGVAALERLAQEPEIDLILLDINMPVMNGFELLQRLKREPAYQRIPVIVITTQGREQDVQRCLALGAGAYLMKPFKAPDLDKLIEQTTGEKPG
jgi:two-component system, chemotaxis family, chemotaxis protein CheY